MKFKKIAAAVLAAAVLAATPATVKLFSPFSVTANAADTLTEGDWTYYVNEDGETVTITKYTGSDAELVIPGTLGGKTVTTIGNSAFKGCTSLASVTIPDGVTTIESYAFTSCKSLTSVIIPSSVTKIGYCFGYCTSLTEIKVNTDNTSYCSVNGVLFNKDKTILKAYPAGKEATNYIIPDSVTAVDPNAFVDCKYLTSLTAPDSVTSFGLTPLARSSNLASINVSANNKAYCSVDGVLFNKDKTELVRYPAGKTSKQYVIPDSVKKIGQHSFEYNDHLTSVTIPSNVTEMDVAAFGDCDSLENVTIESSLTTITSCEFQNCSSLTTVTIPASITSIRYAAFLYCKNLKDVYYGGSKSQWEKISIANPTGENKCLLNATIHFAKEDEEESDTSSEPTSSDTSEPTSSDTSEPTSSDTSEPTSSDTSEPTTSDTSEPTSSDTSEPTSSDTSEPTTSDTSEPTSSDTHEPTSSDTSEPTSSDTHEPTSSDTSEPTSSATSDPTDADIYDEKYDITTDVEPSPDAAGIPDDERVTSVTINAANWINKGEINLDEVKVKVREIYDEEGIKRAEEALGKTLNGNKYNLLDLTLLYNGEDYSNGYEGLIQVKFKIPNGHKNKTISCYRITEVDGKAVKQLIPGTQTEDYYIIYLEHFSLYALVADANPDNGEKPNESEESALLNPGETDLANGSGDGSDGSGTSSSDQKPTGITLAIAPAVLAAGAAVVLFKKRK